MPYISKNMTLTYHLKIVKSLDLHGFEPMPARFLQNQKY